jgi:hypothetical protein
MMMQKGTFKAIKKNSLLLYILLLSCTLNAQQVADTLYNPIVKNPAYAEGQGPVIFIDEAHHNFHTASGRYKPFAALLQKDGYVVKPLSDSFNSEGLSKGKILVIANAIHEDNMGQWTLPIQNAFTESEITALQEWVKKGGSLFLIADHMPFPGAAEHLASSFGIKFYNGFAIRKIHRGDDIFTLRDGLKECSLTNGRNKDEMITSVQTFTGQAFQVPENAVPVIVFDKSYEIKLPQTAWRFTKDTQTFSAENFVQGAYMQYHQGRIVVFGEAAMFTAQMDGSRNKFGMNSPSATQNAQFLLNTIHWLDRLMD